MIASFGDPVVTRMMNEQVCYARFEFRAIMPSITTRLAAFFAHFHMRKGRCRPLYDAKAVWVRPRDRVATIATRK
jgi:hypothetical protein